MLDHDSASLALISRVFDGQAEGLTRDDVLDNITHYWLTNTGVSSGRLYRENTVGFFDPKGVSVACVGPDGPTGRGRRNARRGQLADDPVGLYGSYLGGRHFTGHVSLVESKPSTTAITSLPSHRWQQTQASTDF